MKLGAFSVSLHVKNIITSQKFYENLGFHVFAGNLKSNYLIMKNDATVIGLFQGMFDKNILTFNPGWDQDAKQLSSFTDIREIQSSLKATNVNTGTTIDPNSKGPASFMITDPDGNLILLDQHV